MTTPVAGFESITALAQSLGLQVSTVHKRISRLKSQGVPVTRKSVAKKPVSCIRDAKPVTLADGTQCASIKEAAKLIGSTRRRIVKLLEQGKPIERWCPVGRVVKGSPEAFAKCARILGAWRAEYDRKRAA